MHAEKFFVTSLDNHKIFVRKWSPETSSQPRAIVHILHGMAEHCSRYEPIAECLVEQGYVVFAHDHRGHGHSVPQGGLLGHYADANGWQLVVADTSKVNEAIRKQYPDAPIILFGHSMGSFIAQAYLLQHGRTVQAVVLSGSTLITPMALRSARMLANLEKLRTGPKGRSNLIDLATFSTYNRQVTRNPRTDCDWLSRDEHEVDLYVNDPLCGFLCTNQLWLDLGGGMETVTRISNIRKVPSELPFYLVSGERDPLSYDSGTHGVEKLANHLRQGGIRNVTTHLYENARHEIFNEVNRQQVIADLLEWMNPLFPASKNRKRTSATA